MSKHLAQFSDFGCFSMLKIKWSESCCFFTLLIFVTYRIFCHCLWIKTYILFGLLFFSLVFFLFSIKIRSFCVSVNHIKRSWCQTHEYFHLFSIFFFFFFSFSSLFFSPDIHNCVWFVFHNLSGLLNVIAFSTHFIFSTFGDSKNGNRE